MPFTGIAAAGLGALANIGGGLFSAAGAAGMNAQQMQMQNMYNQQMLNAQMAQHAQQTGFQEDAQAHDIFVRNMGNQWSERQAEKQMWFQREMFEKATGLSNTAYQRTMADMKAAGLNPMLAYQQGGAGAPNAPGGAMGAPGGGSSIGASGGSGVPNLTVAGQINPNSDLGRAIGNAANSAVETYKTIQGVNLMKEQEELTRQQKETNKAVERNTDQDTERKKEETRKTAGEADNTKAAGDLMKAQTHSAGARAAVDTHASRVYGKYDQPTAPTLLERLGRILQGAVESGTVPPAVHQYVPSGPSSGPSDFWGTSDKIRERARLNRERYGR